MYICRNNHIEKIYTKKIISRYSDCTTVKHSHCYVFWSRALSNIDLKSCPTVSNWFPTLLHLFPAWFTEYSIVMNLFRKLANWTCIVPDNLLTLKAVYCIFSIVHFFRLLCFYISCLISYQFTTTTNSIKPSRYILIVYEPNTVG